MTLIHLTIGPLFGTPRTATVFYTVGIAPFIPSNYQKLGLLIFSTLFFIFTYLISYNQSNILDNLGKILNSIFLVLLFLVFIVAFLFPIENPNTVKSTTDYLTSSGAVMNGFLQGYNTMDALAGLAFGVTIITAIRQMGKREDKSIAIGAMSLGRVAWFS